MEDFNNVFNSFKFSSPLNKYGMILSKQKSLNEVNVKYEIWDVFQPLCIIGSGEL